MAKKRSYSFIPTMAVIIIALFAGDGCIVRGKTLEFLDEMEVKVDGVGIESLGLTGAVLNIRTRVINRSDVNFSFKGIDYEIYYGGRLIGSGRDERYHTIHKQAEDTFVFPVNASYADAVATFLRLGQDDVCLVIGRAETISFAGKHAVDFAVETRFGAE